jgi:hypothetical protein
MALSCTFVEEAARRQFSTSSLLEGRRMVDEIAVSEPATLADAHFIPLPAHIWGKRLGI